MGILTYIVYIVYYYYYCIYIVVMIQTEINKILIGQNFFNCFGLFLNHYGKCNTISLQKMPGLWYWNASWRHTTDLKSLSQTRQTIGTSQGPSQQPLEGPVGPALIPLRPRLVAALEMVQTVVLVVTGQTTLLVTTPADKLLTQFQVYRKCNTH